MAKPVCVVVGVGPGNGAAFARKFSENEYQIALLSRHEEFAKKLAQELNSAFFYQCDVTDEHSVQKAFNQIHSDLGEVDMLIYNAGSGTWGNVEEISLEAFQSSWEVNALGLLSVAKQIIPIMKRRKSGNIIIVGATASRRAAQKTAAFAPAKAAQRSLAEAMAKYLWPHKIHVSLIIIDGIVDLPETKKHMPEKPDDFFVSSDSVAEIAFYLSQQPDSAWSFEVEARPFGEVW